MSNLSIDSETKASKFPNSPVQRTLKLSDPESQNSKFPNSKTDPDHETLLNSDPETQLLLSNSKREDLCEKPKKLKKTKKKNQVFLEGYNEDDLTRTKSLTDEDLDELKGCLDLGFGFNYDEIPELCNTLPALELCYSMSQRFLDDKHHQQQQRSPESPRMSTEISSSVPNWRISGPGDHPEDVKARLKYWAQAVACTVRLCS